MSNADLIAEARDTVVAAYPPSSTRNKAEIGYHKSVINRLADALEAADSDHYNSEKALIDTVHRQADLIEELENANIILKNTLDWYQAHDA